MDIVNIIVPVYNVEKYLRQCLDSILIQSYKNIAVFLIDDASTDNSGNICDEYAKLDSRVKVLHKKKNQGLGCARNSGIDLITSGAVTFVDSDDILEEKHIEILFSAMLNNNSDLVIGGAARIDENGQHTGDKRMPSEKLLIGKEIYKKALLPLIAPGKGKKKELSISMSVCFSLYKVSVIQSAKLKFYSEKEVVGEDSFFNIQYLNLCDRVCMISTNTYLYRLNNNSISRSYVPERIERTIMYYKVLLKIAEEVNIKKEDYYRIDRCFITKVRVAAKLIALSNLRFNVKLQELNKLLTNSQVKQTLEHFDLSIYRPTIRVLTWFMEKNMRVLIILSFLVEKFIKNKMIR